MVQLLAHPSDPDVLVVRFGLASEGYLYSRDGGRTFKATCSEAIDPGAKDSDKISRLSGAELPSNGATLIDQQGHVLLAHGTGFWFDDGKGCGWQKDGMLEETDWVAGIQRDPLRPDEVLAAVSLRNVDDVALMRRKADGSWATIGPIKQKDPNEHLLAGDLLAARTATGSRLYVAVSSDDGSITAIQRWTVYASDDGGRSWSERGGLPSAGTDRPVLMAVDPKTPSRVLAVNLQDAAADQLLLSQNDGQSFAKYGEVAAARGIAFADDGRVYIADAGDQDLPGGLWTAAQLGAPLTKIANTGPLGFDCVGVDPTSGKLRVCRQQRFGLLDPATGVFEELARLDQIEALVECTGFNLVAACEEQFNSGPSWCCVGHYAFTPFCGVYDVTRVNNTNVLCGLSGRRAEEANGNGPDGGIEPDSGTVRDAAQRDDGGDDSPAKKKSDGCAIRPHTVSETSAGGLLASIGLLLVVLGRSLRRRKRGTLAGSRD
jgi:hypothetical protein